MIIKKELSEIEMDALRYGAEIPITVEYLKVRHWGLAFNINSKLNAVENSYIKPFAEQLIMEINQNADK